MNEVVIVKLGGSSITYKDRDQALNEEILRMNLQEIHRAGKKVILIHGAGSFGHPLAKQYNLKQGRAALKRINPAYPISETRFSMHSLHQEVLKIGREIGICFYSLPVSANTYETSEQQFEFFAQNVTLALELGLVPVLYGDIVLSKTRGYTILSGDKIIEMLVDKLQKANIKIAQVIFGSDVDGIFTSDPKKDPTASLIELVAHDDIDRVIALTTGSTNQDVTGGMRGKIQNIKKMVLHGTTVKIVNILQKNRLFTSLTASKVYGTVFLPEKE